MPEFRGKQQSIKAFMKSGSCREAGLHPDVIRSSQSSSVAGGTACSITKMNDKSKLLKRKAEKDLSQRKAKFLKKPGKDLRNEKSRGHSALNLMSYFSKKKNKLQSSILECGPCISPEKQINNSETGILCDEDELVYDSGSTLIKTDQMPSSVHMPISIECSTERKPFGNADETNFSSSLSTSTLHNHLEDSVSKSRLQNPDTDTSSEEQILTKIYDNILIYNYK